MATVGISLTKIAHQCAHCQRQFFPKRTDRTTFCSRECGFAFRLAHRLPVEQLAQNNRPASVPSPKCCAVCGNGFASFSPTARYCSAKCREIAAERKRAPHRLKGRACAECGASFVPAYGNKSRTYCSHTCMVKAGRRSPRAKRKLRLRSLRVETVNPTAVFDRDGWRCQLCGIATPRRLRGSIDERAPELDHIIPLSRGGEHSYRNTQCSCRKCNGLKSNGIGGQLRLFG